MVKSSLATIDAEVFVDRKEWISPAHAMAFLRDNGYSKGKLGYGPMTGIYILICFVEAVGIVFIMII